MGSWRVWWGSQKTVFKLPLTNFFRNLLRNDTPCHKGLHDGIQRSVMKPLSQQHSQQVTDKHLSIRDHQFGPARRRETIVQLRGIRSCFLSVFGGFLVQRRPHVSRVVVVHKLQSSVGRATMHSEVGFDCQQCDQVACVGVGKLFGGPVSSAAGVRVGQYDHIRCIGHLCPGDIHRVSWAPMKKKHVLETIQLVLHFGRNLTPAVFGLQ
mmetsp:Transcript_48203/g.94611  ORF Transcript_48203/g.94611 Transcript_48203/m.94611 type:complete len:209 (+) Transcript_48203:1887-2513(+)